MIAQKHNRDYDLPEICISIRSTASHRTGFMVCLLEEDLQ
jgi:hypothetical protein